MTDLERDSVLEEMATLCETAELLFDIRVVMEATKMKMTALAAEKLAELIRSKKSK